MSPLVGAVVAVAVVSLTAPAAPAQQVEPSPRDTVRVAVLESWPPHYEARPGSPPTGFAVDVMENVAVRANLVPRYVVVPEFPEAIAALLRGDVDVIPDFGVSPSRTEEFSFTRSFQAFRLSLVVRSSGEGISSVSDLEGRRVGVVRLNLGAELLPQMHPGLIPVAFDQVQEALFDLLAGGIDGLVYPDEVLLALARAAGVEDRIHILPGALAEVPRAMAVRTADTLLLARLDQAIIEMVASQEYGAIYRRWLSPPRPFWTVPRVLYAAGSLLLAVLLGMGGWRYRTVSRLARRLSETLAEKERLQAARVAEEARFRLLVETSYDGIVVADADDRITFVNRRVCEMLGLEARLLLGRSIAEFVVDQYLDRLEAGTARRRDGIAESYELALRGAGGKTVWVQMAVSPILDASGDFQGSMAVLTDITGRVRAEEDLRGREERFRAFVEHASDLITTLDPEGRIVYHSPALQRILGYDAEAIGGQTAFEFVHPDDLPRMRAAWNEVLQKPGAAISPSPFRLRHADGSWRVWEVTLTNLLDNPAVGAILANGSDVTHREELTRQLTQAQKMDAVGRLAGGVVHDFNNILTVVRSHAEILASDPTPSSVEEAASEIARSVERASALTRQLLAFSRHRAVHPEPLDPGLVVRGLEDTLRRLLGARIDLQLTVEEPTWWTRSDAHQLEQILMNLAVNSSDALPDGGHLDVSVGNLELPSARTSHFGEMPAGEYVQIQFRDDGVGMSPATLRHVFEPFFTTKGPGEGTGLGLSTVYGIIQRSGGYLDVTSAEGRGTTFHLYFPRVPEPTHAKAPIEDVAREGGDVGEQGVKTILVVEDEESVRRAVRRLLQAQGFHVIEADSGGAALEVLGADPGAIDLLITDVVMPGMTGTELVREARARRKDLPSVIMSGYSEERIDLSDTGTSFFLEKPFTRDLLVAVIRRALAETVATP